MATTFYVVRHGEIPANQSKVLPGYDDCLTEKGRDQAVLAAQELLPLIKAEAPLFYSPMPRAAETAEIIVEALKDSNKITTFESDDRLIETSFGRMEGMTWEQADASAENVSRSYIDQTYDFTPYGGGSYEELHSRVYSFVNEMKEKYPNREVVVVTHGGVIRCLYKVEMNQTFENVPGNGSVHTFLI